VPARRAAILGLAALAAGPVLADKLRVDGDRLIYDTFDAPEDRIDIDGDDIDPFLELLRANPQITTVELNSAGGGIWPAQELAGIVMDFELGTEVNGICESSCVLVFLAGDRRSMTRGSRIGFHQVYWSADGLAEYFSDEGEAAGWDSPFEFAEWLHSETQRDVYKHLSYMVSRGVDPGFAIQSLREPSDSMWSPHRSILRAANVLTE
jgi:hypothetical protein